MNLTQEQIRYVEQSLDASNISIVTLREDLLDHLCCSVEAKLQNGSSFHDAVEESLKELAPDGLEQLEYETILLLNSKYLPMKKFTYIIGLLSAMTWTIGFTFRILQMPGGVEMSNAGFFTFVLIFLPITVYNGYKQRQKRTLAENLRIALGFTSALITGIGIFFKMMHFPWVENLMLSGAAVFAFGFLPCLFYTMYVKSLQIASN